MRFTKWSCRNPFWIVVLVALALAAPVLRPGYALFWGTPYFQFIPWRWLAFRLIAQGVFPWWNPYNGLGTPLFANYQTAVLYPPTWLIFLAGWIKGLEGLAYAHGWVMVLHWLWGAWGMAQFARGQGLPREAAWFSGLVFAFSGYSVARAGIFPSMNAAMAWTPWVLWATVRLWKNPSIKNGWLWSGITGMQLLSGHAQTTWYTLALAGFWVTWQALSLWIQHPRTHASSGFRLTSLRQQGTAWLLALMGAGVLALGQLAATGEYTQLSQRHAGLENEQFALQYSFWPWHFLNFLHPRVFGHPATGNVWGYGAPWEDAVYIGALPLLLALWAVLSQPRKLAIWGVALLGSLWLALGWFTPLYPWLYRHVPTFDLFQAPTRWHLITTFVLAYLAGEGLNRLHRPQGRALYWTRLGTAGALALGSTALALGWTTTDPRIQTAGLGMGTFGLLAFGSGLIILRFAPQSSRPSRSRWFWLALLWTGLDLAIIQQGWLPATSVDDYTKNIPSPWTNQVDLSVGRVWMPSLDAYDLMYRDFLPFTTFTPPRPIWQARAALLANANLFEEKPSVNAFDPLLPGRYVALMEGLESLPEPARDRLLARLGVALKIHRAPESAFGVVYLPHGKASLVQWFPRARWFDNPQLALKDVERRAHQGGPSWETVLALTHPPGRPVSPPLIKPRPNPSPSLSPPTIHVRHEANGTWSIHLQAPEDGYLLLAQNAYPGWQVWIDGKRTPWYAGEYALLAFPVPAGEHDIQVVYHPHHLEGALGLQVIGWMIWVGMSFVFRRSSPAKRNPSAQRGPHVST